MAWVRIDDQAPRNAKLLKAGPAACWFWVCGLAHCQSQLTDGFIARQVLGMIGVEGLSKAVQLAERLVSAGLFERVEGGYQIHDYLVFNASKEEAEARHVGKSDKRAQAGRLGGIRSGEAKREAKAKQIAIEATKQVADSKIKPHPIPSHPIQKEREKSASLSPSADPFTDPALTERAGRFIERYQELYRQERNGARYAVKPVRDYAAAVTLCQTWTDDARLEQLAIIFLHSDHKFAEEGSRTLGQFLAMASWCDGKLAELEAPQRSK